MKVFITGSSGTGKTTVIKALAAQGYSAYDTDDTLGSTRLVLRATGESAVLYERLVSRHVHEFGQDPINLRVTVERCEANTAEFTQAGAIAVNAGRPISNVVADILRIIYERR